MWVGDRQVAFLATAGRNGTQELLVLDLDAPGLLPVVAELGPGGWWWARPS